jgi:hypothetical protein
VTPILFQAPDVGLIAPDLVIYLDVQPEVFCLYSLIFILFILATVCLYSLYSVYTLRLWCSIMKVLDFFFSFITLLHTVVMMAIVRP